MKLFFCLLAIVAVGSAAAEPVVFRPAYAPAPADNPLKGFVPYAGQGKKFPHSWGFYHRNTQDILLERVKLTLHSPDARPALRTDDAPAPRLIEFSAPQ